MADVLLRAEGISKSFGAVVALKGVTLELAAGEVAGLVGDNGAGKSTLVKILSGVLRPDAGTIRLDGRDADLASPAAARAQGIETVYQDLALVGSMAVWANVYLGRELLTGPAFLNLLNKRRMMSNARDMLGRFVGRVPPLDAPVEQLSGGQRQIVAIARAGAWGSKLIIMDEPTAALGVAETRAVEEVIAGMRERGLTILVISHNLDQVFRITDRIWVLRRGEMIGSRRTGTTRPEEIVAMITGAASADRKQ
jgi:ABC-type sugar transport system ATPase subunit